MVCLRVTLAGCLVPKEWIFVEYAIILWKRRLEGFEGRCICCACTDAVSNGRVVDIF